MSVPLVKRGPVILVLELAYRIANKDQFAQLFQSAPFPRDVVDLLPTPELVPLQGQILQPGKVMRHSGHHSSACQAIMREGDCLNLHDQTLIVR